MHSIVKLLARLGLGPQTNPEKTDPLLRDQPLLAELYGASVCGMCDTDDQPQSGMVSYISLEERMLVAVRNGTTLADHFGAMPPHQRGGRGTLKLD